MKILFITESFPYPLDSGGKIVSYQMLKMLSTKHRIDLVALTDVSPTKKDIHAIASLGIKIHIIIAHKRNPWYKQSKLELLHALFRFQSPALTSFYEKSLESQINQLLNTERFDIIHIEHLSMAQYFPKEKTTTWIFQEQNIEHNLYQDFYRVSPSFSKEQLLHLYNYLTLSRFEQKVLNRVDQIILLSEQDKTELEAIGIPSKKMLFVPPYIISTRQNSTKKNRGAKLIFIGSLWWKPNLDAITWFLKKIFPLVQKTNPTVSLTVIGEKGNLLSEYTRNNSSIHLLGKLDNITPYLNRASVFILPFRVGEGVRIKALTAMSHGIPVVSTDIGMRGLIVHAGKEYLSANDPLSFAQQITTLIHNPKLQNNLTTNASKYIQKNHNPTSITQHLLKYYARDSISA